MLAILYFFVVVAFSVDYLQKTTASSSIKESIPPLSNIAIRSVLGSKSETLFRVGFVHLHLQTIIAAAADAVFRPVKVLLRQFLCIRVIYVGMENKEAAHKLKLTTQNTTNRWNAELTI